MFPFLPILAEDTLDRPIWKEWSQYSPKTHIDAQIQGQKNLSQLS